MIRGIGMTILAVALLALTVGPALAAVDTEGEAIEISELEVAYDETWNPLGRGDITVTWTVTNRTNEPVEIESEVDISGPGGLAARPTRTVADRGGESLAPGASQRFEFTTRSWPMFTVQATVRVLAHDDGGPSGRSPADATVTQSGEVSATAIPRPQILAVVIGVLALIVIHRWRIEMVPR